jgi:hypothetical protein
MFPQPRSGCKGWQSKPRKWYGDFMAVIPLRPSGKPSLWPTVPNVVVIVLVGLCAALGHFILRDRPSEQMVTSASRVIQSISVIDGDTVRFEGSAYRLVGFHTPEKGDRG